MSLITLIQCNVCPKVSEPGEQWFRFIPSETSFAVAGKAAPTNPKDQDACSRTCLKKALDDWISKQYPQDFTISDQPALEPEYSFSISK